MADSNVDSDKQIVDIWKATVEVQKHFNDIELKIRNLAITILGAFLAAIGLAFQQNMFITLFHYNVHLSVFLCIGALVVCIAFFFMDKYWYHPLLIGAVKYGESIEKQRPQLFGDVGLTTTISNYSPITIFKVKIHSNHKFYVFYGLITLCILVLLVISLFGISSNDSLKSNDTNNKNNPHSKNYILNQQSLNTKFSKKKVTP